MSKTWQKIILIASQVILVGGWLFWSYLWKGAFYHCLAVFILLIMYLVRDLTVGVMRKVATIGCVLAVNNIVDELFFDPTKLYFNELFLSIIVILIIFKRK